MRKWNSKLVFILGLLFVLLELLLTPLGRQLQADLIALWLAQAGDTLLNFLHFLIKGDDSKASLFLFLFTADRWQIETFGLAFLDGLGDTHGHLAILGLSLE